MLTNSLQILEKLQYKNGLFAASKVEGTTGYNHAWIRDNVYETLGFEATNNYKKVIKTYRALLNIFLKHEYKIDWMIKEPQPKAAHRYIHARYNPENLDEIWEEWGNKQNDAIGAFLFKVGDLESKGVKILRDDNDKRILQKLVDYLESIAYWQDPDNGMWEEWEELHASSIGACVAGLKKISKIVNVNSEIIDKGQKALNRLLPFENENGKVDLALLSLIYPYKITSESQTKQILENVEKYLVREKGVIRYLGDQYYNKHGEPAWTMGLPWLAIIYKQLNRPDKYAHYMRKCVNAINDAGELPELYYANSKEHNENSPLGWAQSLFVVANMV